MFSRSINKLKQIPLMKQKFGQNLSQIGALCDFFGQKNLDCQSSGIELSSALCVRFQRRWRKDTGQTAASAECGACKLNFEMRVACSRDGCLTYVFSASYVSHSRLWNRKQMRATSEGQRMLATLLAYLLFTPQTFLLLLQLNPNSASPIESLLKRGRCGV